MQESAADAGAQSVAARQRGGVFYAVGVYGLWGLLPAYFLVLAPAGPIEIVGWRILDSPDGSLALFCVEVPEPKGSKESHASRSQADVDRAT